MRLPAPKIRSSIFNVQAAIYLLIILFLSLTFGFFFFSTAKRHLETEVGKKLQDISRIAARNAPVDRLDLIKVGDDETRMVLRLKEKLGEIREATGVKNIFIFRTDQTSLLDLMPGALIGRKYALPHFDRRFLNELGRGRSVSTGSYHSSSGNLYISAYAPILDDNHRLFAVVGVDAGTREIEVIEQMRVQLYWIAVGGALFTFALTLFLARRLTKPIRGMAETAERIGQGNYQARVSLPNTAELAMLAESINTMAQQVQRRDDKLKEMSARVAHEIRNPLNSIKLQITLLDQELGELQITAQKPVIARLNYEIGKLNRFLSEFLTYSRPLTLRHDDVAPAELAAAAADMATAEAAEQGVAVEIVAESDLPLICVDRQKLEQSLLNLILNAIQASPASGHVKVRVGRSAEDQGVDFTVEDMGPGLTPEAAERLFEPFFTTKETGTGLGLANAQKIVTSHGGTISAATASGRGACFIIHLPSQVALAAGGKNGELSDCR